MNRLILRHMEVHSDLQLQCSRHLPQLQWHHPQQLLLLLQTRTDGIEPTHPLHKIHFIRRMNHLTIHPIGRRLYPTIKCQMLREQAHNTNKQSQPTYPLPHGRWNITPSHSRDTNENSINSHSLPPDPLVPSTTRCTS